MPRNSGLRPLYWQRSFSIVYTGKLSGASSFIVGFSLMASLGYVSIVLGQIVPVALASSVFAALCARRRNGTGAAVGAAFAAIEPHLALPVWLGLILFVPNARKPLVVAAGVLLSITLWPGVPLNTEYVRLVMPQHARSELLNFGGQYGLSALLAAIGVPFESAIRAGSASYAAMLAFGLIVGAALQRRSGDAAFAVTAPLASIVLGGPFLHITQTVVAIPLAFMLVAIRPRRMIIFGAATFAICMLAIPWQLVGKTSAPHREISKSGSVFTAAPPHELIEVPYTVFVDAFGRRAFPRSSFPEEIERKLPTWIALIAILGSTAWIACDPLGVARTTVRCRTK